MTKKKDDPVPRPTLRQMFEAALDEAAADPEAFVKSTRTKIQRGIATARAIRQEIQNDPEQPLRAIKNGFIQGVARRLKREFFE